MGVFREIVAGEFSAQMETLLKPCLTTLLLRRGSTLLDLVTFMDPERNGDLLAFAQKHLPNHTQRSFLRDDFPKDAYNPTRQSLKTKLQSLLNSYTFLNFTVGESTFDLESLVNRRAVVIFNLSTGRLGEYSSRIIGRFILSKLQYLALSRQDVEERERVSCHVFVDECQLYIAQSIERILTEARKYRVFLTFAQQILGHGMSTELRDIVLGNTGVKITGGNGTKTLTAIAKETGADIEDLQRLKPGRFHVWTRGRVSVGVRIPGNRVGRRGAMSADRWAHLRENLLARFYRPVSTTGNAPTSTTREAQTAGESPMGAIRPALPIDL